MPPPFPVARIEIVIGFGTGIDGFKKPATTAISIPKPIAHPN
jgi:hypothetical protein